jgi:hypothetical protein
MLLLDILRDFVRDFSEFAKTSHYLHGVYVALTLILIQILLLSWSVPIAIYVYRRFRTRHLRVVITISLFQVFHNLITLCLEMASVIDKLSILLEEQNGNPNFPIYSNYLYGNVENKLFILKKVLQEGTFEGELGKRICLTLADIQK